MGKKTGIEWTESTWNPATGCVKISEGCKNCYAETLAERFRGVPGNAYEQGFDLRLWPDRLEIPVRWTKPRMIFVNSMSDLFLDTIPLEFVKKVFAVMNKATHHTFQILTKRHERLVELKDEFEWTDNIWMGVSVENDRWKVRADYLRKVPAKVRFLSIEPMIGPVTDINLTDIHWVIAGGESGPGARPMEAEWVRHVRDTCIAADVPFFMKQWGGVNKKAAGKTLDGVNWCEMPIVAV